MSKGSLLFQLHLRFHESTQEDELPLPLNILPFVLPKIYSHQDMAPLDT